MSNNPFTAYKTSLCGNQIKRDFRHGLTLKECKRLPKGPRKDSGGSYVWQYGVAAGGLI